MFISLFLVSFLVLKAPVKASAIASKSTYLYLCAASYGEAASNCTGGTACTGVESVCAIGQACFAVPLDACVESDVRTNATDTNVFDAEIMPSIAPTAAPNGTLELPAVFPTAPPGQPRLLYVCGANYTDADMNVCVNTGCPSGDGCDVGLTCFAVPFVVCGATTAMATGGTTVASVSGTMVSSMTDSTSAMLEDSATGPEYLLRRMVDSVLAFRDHIERLYTFRCDPGTLAECTKGNYDDCSSVYRNQRCLDSLGSNACGSNCKVLVDETQTAVRIPTKLADSNGNPTDPHVIESVCYSRLAERYMIDNFKQGRQMYFGSFAGSFRIIPARHSETCGDFDPRYRPWFTAASSGPKDVVIVIDVSASMDDYNRMELAKEAASTVVKTLSAADKFALITFSESAVQTLGEGTLMQAENENKDMAIEVINNITVDRKLTNFYAAFEKAFDTIEAEYSTGCNVAILFLTDGKITTGPGKNETIALVNQRIHNLETNSNQTTTIFTYSLGLKADHNLMKRLACETKGIWTQVDDSTDDLITAMSSYYKLYALGLGQGGNEDWVAWVEPYQFYTGGRNGTSVSAPVYDRSVTPPLFLGAVAVDMLMDDYELALGAEASSSFLLEKLVRNSTSRCPKIELNECELEAFQKNIGRDSMCNVCNDTAIASVTPNVCSNQGDLPSDVWSNTEMKGTNFTKRACCEVGQDVPSSTCSATVLSDSTTDSTKLSSKEVIGICLGVTVPVVLIICVMCVRGRNKTCQHASTDARTDTESVKVDPMIHRMSSSINESVSVIAPPGMTPSAPPLNPSYSSTLEAEYEDAA
ncbi:hypothetical protein ACHAW6_008953 [Cyclotella cf. meneghiniana]